MGKEKATHKAKPYIHIDEFFSKRKIRLPEHVAKGFKVYMKGKTFQRSMEDFEKALEEFLNRFKQQ